MILNWFSNAPWSTTGYGNQTRLYTPRLKAAGHDVSITAFWGLEGSVLTWGGMRVYPKGFHPYGQDVMAANSAHAGAEITITLLDAWVCEPSMMIHGMHWVPWFPVDSEPLARIIRDKVKQAFARIVFSRFGEEQVKAAGLDCFYVPHGVDTNLYSPRDVKDAREKLGWPADKFVVGMVAANKGNPSRKAFDPQLRAFAAFHKRHSDSVLYLHTLIAEKGESMGVPLQELVKHLDIEDAVAFCDQYQYVLGFPEAYMVNAYSGMDVHMLASCGEGFGIPTLEAQACGTPVIVGDWTASSELCFSGWKIPKDQADPWWTQLGAYQFMPRQRAIENALEKAYSARGNEVVRQKARNGALAFDADLIVEKYWQPVLEEIHDRITSHTHQWVAVGLWNPDGSLSMPCKDCGAEKIQTTEGERIVEKGFEAAELKLFEPDGLEYIIWRETKRDYDVGLALNVDSKVVDIGGHVGIVSMYLAKKYGCKCWIYEPTAGNYARLVENIRLNELEGLIKPFNLAVTGDGRDVMIGGGIVGNSGEWSIYGDGTLGAKSTTLAAILEETGPIDLLKLDCEGAEFEILEDPTILKDRVKMIRGEYHKAYGDGEAMLMRVREVVPDTKMVAQG